MAQTRKKRRSKHRGTAAGTIEARGRTGRKPTKDEARASTREEARRRRMERMTRPPSWRSAANRALVATVVFFVAVIVLFGQPAGAALSLAGFMLLVYIPMGYYTDLWLYRRRRRTPSKTR